MKVLRTIRNYLCNCGIENEEYLVIKKDAYVSNFMVWRLLHIIMTLAFGFLFINSLFSNMLEINKWIYLGAFGYSLIEVVIFFTIKKDSIIAQLLIYLSISVLFLFGAFITRNKPEYPAAAFIAFLLITPMFMIDRPFFMGIELGVASIVFLVWMYYIKPYEIWRMDFVNIISFTLVGFFIHVISNSIRIREFVLTRKLEIQKDHDDMTGLKNKGALTREINAFLADESKNKGVLFMLDIDGFKSINDTYGHDVGDSVIKQLGKFLANRFINGEVVGRFGGDEFIIFIKDIDDEQVVENIAGEVVTGLSSYIELPDENQKVYASMGIAIYHGQEKNYSEIFKKADVALYKAKADKATKYCFYQ